MCICNALLLVTPSFYYGVIGGLVLAEMTMTIAYYHIFVCNRKAKAQFSIHTVTHSLDARYALAETIKTTEMKCHLVVDTITLFKIVFENVLFSVTTHAICWTSAMLSSIPFHIENVKAGEDSGEFVGSRADRWSICIILTTR